MLLEILTITGYFTTIFVVISIIASLIMWGKGVIPALWRLGNGLAKRKVVIFANGENGNSLRDLLVDSSLFNKKNIDVISSVEDIGRAENKNLYIMYWNDWAENIDNILSKKTDQTAFIIYAPQDIGRVPDEQIKKVNQHRNVILVNFRGRLINDIVSSLITTSYEKR